jgi:hypothetical protein
MFRLKLASRPFNVLLLWGCGALPARLLHDKVVLLAQLQLRKLSATVSG